MQDGLRGGVRGMPRLRRRRQVRGRGATFLRSVFGAPEETSIIAETPAAAGSAGHESLAVAGRALSVAGRPLPGFAPRVRLLFRRVDSAGGLRVHLPARASRASAVIAASRAWT